ncbi:uncharacterized protein RHO17_015241 [Thomomys bottae]
MLPQTRPGGPLANRKHISGAFRPVERKCFRARAPWVSLATRRCRLEPHPRSAPWRLGGPSLHKFTRMNSVEKWSLEIIKSKKLAVTMKIWIGQLGTTKSSPGPGTIW